MYLMVCKEGCTFCFTRDTSNAPLRIKARDILGSNAISSTALFVGRVCLERSAYDSGFEMSNDGERKVLSTTYRALTVCLKRIAKKTTVGAPNVDFGPYVRVSSEHIMKFRRRYSPVACAQVTPGFGVSVLDVRPIPVFQLTLSILIVGGASESSYQSLSLVLHCRKQEVLTAEVDMAEHLEHQRKRKPYSKL